MVPFVLPWVADENASGGPWVKFVLGGGIHVWKAQATKGTEVIIRWVLLKKEKVRCVVVNGSRGSYVEEMIGGV
jgi:hypothetical protein